MRFFYQSSSRSVYIQGISSEIPGDAFEISEADYIEIISTAVSITGDDTPDWIIPDRLKKTGR